MIGCHFEAEETLASVSFIKLCSGKKCVAEMLIKHARVAITLPMPLHVLETLFLVSLGLN